MRRILFLFFAVILSFTVYSSNAQAKLTEREEHIVKTITDDFIQTHDVAVTGYELILIKELAPFNKKKLTAAKESLSNIFLDIHNQQIIGDFAPLFYLNEKDKKGYVMEKKLSGMNHLYILSYDDSTKTWRVKNTSKKMGTDLDELGLLKRAN